MIRVARARLPPARVLGVVNKPKIGDVASRGATGGRVTDSPPPPARRDARCRPSAVTSSHTLCSPSSAVARGADASRSRRRRGDDASGVTRERDGRDGANPARIASRRGDADANEANARCMRLWEKWSIDRDGRVGAVRVARARVTHDG